MRDRSREVYHDLPTNANYENDVHYTLQLCQWVLKPIGIWPLVYPRATRFQKVISMILITMCFTALCFVLVPSGYYTLFRAKDTNVKLKLFGPIGFCATSTIKYCYLGLRGGEFSRCIEHVLKDWRNVHDGEHRRIMMRNVTVGRNLITLCAAFLYTGGLSYHTAMPLLSKRTNENTTERSLTYPGYDVFFDPQASPTYEIVFVVHCIYALVTYNITTAACSLAAIFVTHACGQIQIQMARLEGLVDGTKGKGQGNTLSLIVRDHVEVLRFSAHIEEVLREICLLEIVASTLIICLLEYYCMTEWENSDTVAILTYFILLISFTFNILIFCYIGELLVEQGSKIGAASYEIEWYNLTGTEARGLILLIAISKFPPKLTAGKIFDLSLNTFSTVLKSSVVYLNLLRTMIE